jgi:3-methyl-2-oxobutanoate hydroxymethyltransferase
MEVVSSTKVTVPELSRMKKAGHKIVMLTAYDFTTARVLDSSNVVDILLIGDSLSTVVQGNETTIPVTLEEMIYHSKMVARGAHRALVIADMPFMSFQLGVRDALMAAGRLMKEAGVAGVKIEGGRRYSETVRALVDAGIPVMGHIGLLPQSYHVMGGYKIQGKKGEEANALIEDALSLQEAGAFAMVLEGMPGAVASRITAAIDIPTIGIGAGADCSGQVLVINDLMGFNRSSEVQVPKFVKQYFKLTEALISSVQRFSEEVQSGQFPSEEHAYSLNQKQKLSLHRGDKGRN